MGIPTTTDPRIDRDGNDPTGSLYGCYLDTIRNGISRRDQGKDR